MRTKRVFIITCLLISSLSTCYSQVVKDIEGNTYKTVQIGTQTWMAENLKTTKYSNGNIIGTTNPPNKKIIGEQFPKYQWPVNGDENNTPIYGRLYTWHAATDERGVCPNGWHLPSRNDWLNLVDYLGGIYIADKLMETTTTFSSAASLTSRQMISES